MEKLTIDERIERLRGTAATAWQADAQGAMTAVADAEKALRRVIKRAETLPAEYDRGEIVQRFGPTLEFTARSLCAAQFNTRSGIKKFEILETQGGSMIAIMADIEEGSEDEADVRTHIVPPEPDEQARRFDVMAFFGWHDRARSMVRKLGWSLRQDVE